MLHFMSVATRGRARQTRSQMTHPEVDQPHFQTLVLALRQKPQPVAQVCSSPAADLQPGCQGAYSSKLPGWSGHQVSTPPPVGSPFLSPAPWTHFPAKSCTGVRLLTERDPPLSVSEN